MSWLNAKVCKKCHQANCSRRTTCVTCGGSFSGRGGKARRVQFDDSVELPADWDQLVNIDDDLLNVCTRRITQQRTYDKKPLGTGVCYRCGHMLWTTVDGAHTFLVNKPSGMSVDDAPASTYFEGCA